MSGAFETYAARVRAATASRSPLRIRGGSSKDFYGGPLSGEILDMRPCAGIVAYEPTELVITARCGTPLAEIEAVLAERGQRLAFEPPHFTPLAPAREGAEGGGRPPSAVAWPPACPARVAPVPARYATSSSA